MSPRRSHFEERAARLADCATLQVTEKHGAVTLQLLPHNPNAVGVILYRGPGDTGTVGLDDQAAAPSELGSDVGQDLHAIDQVIDVAVDGRATAFHIGRGGCVEERDGDSTSRSWMYALPWPGWRRRSEQVQYRSYR